MWQAFQYHQLRLHFYFNIVHKFDRNHEYYMRWKRVFSSPHAVSFPCSILYETVAEPLLPCSAGVSPH